MLPVVYTEFLHRIHGSRSESRRDALLLADPDIFVGPYDAIHVGAAAPTLPQPLIDQLACPGRMFIPVGEEAQSIIQVSYR